MLQKLGIIQPQVMRDTNVQKIVMAQGQRPYQTIDWEMNHMNQMHHFIFHIGSFPTINCKRQFKDTV